MTILVLVVPVLEQAGRTVHHMGEGGADKPPSGRGRGVRRSRRVTTNLGIEWRALVRDGDSPNCIF